MLATFCRITGIFALLPPVTWLCLGFTERFFQGYLYSAFLFVC